MYSLLLFVSEARKHIIFIIPFVTHWSYKRTDSIGISHSTRLFIRLYACKLLLCSIYFVNHLSTYVFFLVSLCPSFAISSYRPYALSLVDLIIYLSAYLFLYPFSLYVVPLKHTSGTTGLLSVYFFSYLFADSPTKSLKITVICLSANINNIWPITDNGSNVL